MSDMREKLQGVELPSLHPTDSRCCWIISFKAADGAPRTQCQSLNSRAAVRFLRLPALAHPRQILCPTPFSFDFDTHNHATPNHRTPQISLVSHCHLASPPFYPSTPPSPDAWVEISQPAARILAFALHCSPLLLTQASVRDCAIATLFPTDTQPLPTLLVSNLVTIVTCDRDPRQTFRPSLLVLPQESCARRSARWLHAPGPTALVPSRQRSSDNVFHPNRITAFLCIQVRER